MAGHDVSLSIKLDVINKVALHVSLNIKLIFSSWSSSLLNDLKTYINFQPTWKEKIIWKYPNGENYT